MTNEFLYLVFFCSTSNSQLSPATNTMTRPTPPPGSITSLPPLHSTASTHSAFPPPLFATPLPPPAVSSASSIQSAPHPFSAESLFQSSKGMYSKRFFFCLRFLYLIIDVHYVDFPVFVKSIALRVK